MASSGDHQLAGAQLAAGVEHQASDLFAQFEVAVDVVVIQAGHVLPPADSRQVTQQRFHGRTGDVRHAATQLHHVFARNGANQLQHLIPLGNVHRPLGRAADCRQIRQFAAGRDEVPGLGPRHGQPAVLQHPIGLLHCAQADAVLDAQRPNRRQPVTGAIEALLDTCAEQFGEVDVKGHGAASIRVIRLTSTDRAKNRDSVAESAKLYGVNTVALNL
ncbi:hypothetical protein D3C75_669440 [compost metagenome]